MKSLLQHFASTLAVCVLLTGCCTARRTTAWEYKTVMVQRGNPDETINPLANQGWKMVSFSVTEPTPNVWNYHYLLRRPSR